MFNQKETDFLNDLKKSEQLCIEKYTKYENNASNKDLKMLMNTLARQERTHLDTLNQISSGSVPSTSGGQGSQNQQQAPAAADYSNNSAGYENDKYLCNDALATEKHVSSEYNTSIFEFKSKAVRDALNHIQKEEQEHGDVIYSYMSQNNMYN